MAFSASGGGSGNSLGTSLGKGNALYRPLAEINVTPLVDVMLVLLIIFMVTAPMLATGMKIDLPQAKQAKPLERKEPVVVTVEKEGRLSVGRDIVEKNGLIEAVRSKMEGDANRVIFLRGDKAVAYGEIVGVMDLLASNGFTHLAVVADAREKREAPAPSSPTTPAPALSSEILSTETPAYSAAATTAGSQGSSVPASLPAPVSSTVPSP